MGIDVVDDLHLKSLATYAGQAQLGRLSISPCLHTIPLPCRAASW